MDRTLEALYGSERSSGLGASSANVANNLIDPSKSPGTGESSAITGSAAS